MGVRQQKNHALGLAERVRAEDNTDSGVYFLGWTGVFFGVSLGLVLLATLLGGPKLLSLLLFPVAMLMSAMFFSSLYFTFRDSFTTDDGQAPA